VDIPLGFAMAAEKPMALGINAVIMLAHHIIALLTTKESVMCVVKKMSL
jgi:hypothetical protein